MPEEHLACAILLRGTPHVRSVQITLVHSPERDPGNFPGSPISLN